MHYGSEQPDSGTSKITLSHELGSECVSERANEWAVRSEQMSERCDWMSKRMSEWHSTLRVNFIYAFYPLCIVHRTFLINQNSFSFSPNHSLDSHDAGKSHLFYFISFKSCLFAWCVYHCNFWVRWTMLRFINYMAQEDVQNHFKTAQK